MVAHCCWCWRERWGSCSAGLRTRRQRRRTDRWAGDYDKVPETEWGWVFRSLKGAGVGAEGGLERKIALIGWAEIKPEKKMRWRRRMEWREGEVNRKERSSGRDRLRGLPLGSQSTGTGSVGAALQLMLCQDWWIKMQEAGNTSATHARTHKSDPKCLSGPQ